MNNKDLFKALLFAGLIVGGIFVIKHGAQGEKQNNRPESIYDKINLLTEVMKKVSDNYVKEVSDEELLMRAIRWMVHS